MGCQTAVQNWRNHRETICQQVFQLSSSRMADGKCRRSADENGLYGAKMQCRLTIPTKGKRWKFLKWTEFLPKCHADPLIASSLKQGSGADWRN